MRTQETSKSEAQETRTRGGGGGRTNTFTITSGVTGTTTSIATFSQPDWGGAAPRGQDQSPGDATMGPAQAA